MMPEHETAAPAPESVRRIDTATFGPLARYLAEPGVCDLLIDGRGALWIDRGRGVEAEPRWRIPGEAAVRSLAIRLIALGGRHLDEAHPCIDVPLGDGIRVHAVLPPVATGGTLLSIRVPGAEQEHTLESLEAAGMFGSEPGGARVRARLEHAVRERQNLLITGAAGSGKTTLLAALLAIASPSERVVVIEDVAELRIRHPHVVGLQTRQATREGLGELGLAELLRQALRMRPDRLVLGECRGGEVRELCGALNTGHAGSAGTLHANGVREVPARLAALGALAGLDESAMAQQAAAAFDLVVHLLREPDGRRRVGALAGLELRRGRLITVPES